MKDIFFGYYQPSDDDFSVLWREGVFVFDTNVLLNMYSYPDSVREVFFSVLRRIQSRIWIPFHVGVEFHRNRFSRLMQSNKPVQNFLSKIKKISSELNEDVARIELEKRNIGSYDVEGGLESIHNACLSLSSAVEQACEHLPPISLNDPIAEKLSSLLSGKVGHSPKDQEEINKLQEEADKRFSKMIPPGYCDKDKVGEEFRFQGIDYQNRYGDLIVWRQFLNHLQGEDVKNAIFVTGDRKEDWWWKVDGKTLGPHPELFEEAISVGKLERF
jgi:hypothetical protein